ncbi:hypothetical protein ACO1O0_004160 [Amphichorda felina]
MQPMYGSNPHTPRTPGTPNTPNSTNNLPPSYQQQTSQPAGSRGIYSMPQQNQYQPPPGYGTSGPMMPQTTTASSGPQPIAPAPAGSRAPPVLRPMPPGGIMSQQPGVSSPYGPGSSLMQPQSMVHEGEQPTHVVGSQGRRGILPSAPGRPAAPAAGTGAPKSTVIPVKDADGKFPCPHCTKTYLHAKHLKRHLLRHTGDRPYMCVLCRDTFSRSDILKRHFQKCSIRRGNPTGVSHLSHPQAHVRKNQNQKPAGMGEGDLNQLNGLNNMPPQDGMGHPFGMVPVSDGMNNMGSESHLSRSSSISRLDNPNGSDRRGMGGPVMGTSQPYHGSDVSSSMSNQPMPSYNMPPGQNGMPMYGGSNSNQQSGLDWSQMFQAGAHPSYVSNSTFPNLGQTQTAIKTEPDSSELRPAGDSFGEAPFYSNWGMPSNIHNPYNKLSDRILNLFYPPSENVDPHLAGMNLYFSPDNIKDFLENYTHFHVHTPVLHLPTFKVMESYIGLVAAMCCIGACYSDRVHADDVRQMMDFLWIALERDCKVLSSVDLSETGSQDADKADTEQLQAVLIMSILTLWNGNPQQRERARQTFPILASQARRLNLFSLSRTSSLYSPLHESNFDPAMFRVDHFDWELWIEQERRVRVMIGIFLGDVAMGLYFNILPQVDPLELQIPLPCDDAAWDANTAKDCMAALGLLGQDAVRDKNPFGTQRTTQPEVRSALKALLHPSIQIQPGSTNLYGKFVLIHAIMGLIYRAQTREKGAAFYNNGTPPPGDWVVPSTTSGRATPVKGVGQEIEFQNLKALSAALDKFKYSWDVDMVTQFPPSTQTANPKRSGFSRDGIHFYWLAKYVLKFTTSADLQLPADARLIQVISLLKSVRKWVLRDGASRGEELGSIGEIDEDYGTVDLTLDMAKLFRPLPQVVGDAETAFVKTELGHMGG